jgi:predicted aminopeptidase
MLIHELFHGTFYIPGRADFNESAATFAGHRGTIGFFERSEGSESTSYARAMGRWMDSLKFSGFLEGVLDRLNSIYQADIPLDEKLRQKQEIFARSTEDFKVLQTTLQVKNYGSGFLRLNLNNAVVLHYWLYHKELNIFEKVYAASGGDLARALGRIQQCGKDREDPFQKLREFGSAPSDGRGSESPPAKDFKPGLPGSTFP